MNKSSKINVNASSLVDLKAELFKKQEQLKRERLQPQGNSSSSARAKHGETKKPSIWSKTNAGVTARAEKDLEKIAEERNELENARSKLEAKAKFYEQMTQGGYIPDSDSGERFLVDFEKKALDHREDVRSQVRAGPAQREEEEEERQGEDDDDIPPPANRDEEWVDYTDTLGRSRRCLRKDLPHLISMDRSLNPQVFVESDKREAEEKKKGEELPDLLSNDMYREMLRQKWEQEEEAAAKGPQGSTHYQNIKYDEVRDMGVGYFDFSKDKSERNEQMETLQLLRDETMDQRQRREKLKQKRKAAMQARLEKVKERKRQRGELVEEDKEVEEEKEETEEKKKDAREQSRLGKTLERDSEPKEKRVREWDVGKEPVSPWEQKLGNLRDERPSEFAPPSIYGGSNIQKKYHQSTHYPPPKDYSSTYGNSKEKTAAKSSNSASYWNKPSGSSHVTQPFGARGMSNFSSQGGSGGTANSYGQKTQTGGEPPKRTNDFEMQRNATSGGDSSEDAISSALSYFRKNATK